MPLAALQSVTASSQEGIEKIYRRVAETLGSKTPDTNHEKLIEQVTSFETGYSKTIVALNFDEKRREMSALARMLEALEDPRFVWRNVKRLAAIAGGIGEEEAADLLRRQPQIVFGRGKKSKELIVRLVHRKPKRRAT